MMSRRRHLLRASLRLAWLISEFPIAAVRYAFVCGFFRSPSTGRRAKWLHYSSARVLRIFGPIPRVTGKRPHGGLLVCNHLSYLDILVLASVSPCVFVAKNDVRGWPVFGWFARLAGTVFVDRERRTRAPQTASEIEAALHTGVTVVLFPEGTSSGGDTVLPFRSSLLEPVAKEKHSITAAAIGYKLTDGDVSEEICYWKDMTLVPHLWNLLGKRAVHSTASFKEIHRKSSDRKELARELHKEVLNLKNVLL